MRLWVEGLKARKTMLPWFMVGYLRGTECHGVVLLVVGIRGKGRGEWKGGGGLKGVVGMAPSDITKFFDSIPQLLISSSSILFFLSFFVFIKSTTQTSIKN